jgi:hypothetical protein
VESEATQLTAAMNRGFIGTQILAKLEAYQMPPIGREIHINNAEQLYKVKLLDFNEKLAAMSAVEFDGISRGRVAKNTEETCFAIVKVLFQGVKIGLEARDQQASHSVHQDKAASFRKFEDMLI